MALEIRNSNLQHQDYFVLLNAIVGRDCHTADITAPQNNLSIPSIKRTPNSSVWKKDQTMDFKMQKKKKNLVLGSERISVQMLSVI